MGNPVYAIDEFPDEAASMQAIARVESQVQNPLRPDFPHEARTQQGK